MVPFGFRKYFVPIWAARRRSARERCALHRYLRAIGFSQITTKKQLRELITYSIQRATEKSYTSGTEDDSMFAEFSMACGERIGITVRGEFDETNNFTYDYYFPYVRGEGVTTQEDVSVERHAAQESYAGVCDDMKVGVTLIFYMQNIVPYIRAKNLNLLPVRGTTLTLSALCISGTIMMPIVKSEKQKASVKKATADRYSLLAAARRGDEEAIESLTLEDMDTYTAISRKIHTQDIYSLVDTYFMPYGVECDQYSLLGEIMECRTVTNVITSEQVYILTVNCNELIFDVCINSIDLLGEPAVGRRFKGVLWLQGYLHFPN